MSTPETTPTDTPVMSAPERQAERSRGRWAGFAAVAAVVLIVAGAIWSSQIDLDDTGGKPVIEQKDPRATGETKQDRERAQREIEDDRDEVNGLASIDNNFPTFIGAALLNALAFVLLLFPALALYRATRARNPSEPSIVGVMAVYGPIALGIGTVVRAVALKDISADFVGQEFATLAAAAEEARNLKEGTAFVIFQALMASGALAFAFWLIKGAWDAAKVGLLPKPYAVLGMALPLLTLIATPLAAPIALFWMVALGLLLLGRWPSGIPPAWEAGQSIPWPSRAEIAAAGRRPEAGGERNGEVNAVGPGVSSADPDQADPDQPPQPRRKRKRRS